MDFFVSIFLWFMFVYGLIEFLRNIINFFYCKNKVNYDGISIIIAVKNGEKSIEGFLRDFILKNATEVEEKEIIITDLNSSDNTLNILNRMKNEYSNITIKKFEDLKIKLEKLEKE